MQILQAGIPVKRSDPREGKAAKKRIRLWTSTNSNCYRICIQDTDRR